MGLISALIEDGHIPASRLSVLMKIDERADAKSAEWGGQALRSGSEWVSVLQGRVEHARFLAIEANNNPGHLGTQKKFTDALVALGADTVRALEQYSGSIY